MIRRTRILSATRAALLLASLPAVLACSSGGGDAASPPDPAEMAAAGGSAAMEPTENPSAAGLQQVPPQPEVNELPDVVYMKTNRLSYNRLYYFGVENGALFAKPNPELSGQDGPWVEMSLPPELAGRVSEISTDDYEIIVLDDQRNIWVGVGVLGPLDLVTWKSEWGFPFGAGPGYALPPASELIRWEWVSIGAEEDICRPDIAGNCHSPGSSNVSHIWMLFEGGQRLQYNDPWLPADTSYGSCTPHRGRFRAIGLAGSGSHLFVINEMGDMFTRLYDFDLSGGNSVFVSYSYEPQPSGSTVHQLPPHGWVPHPKISGVITDHISLHKIGTMSVNRVMRVEGTDDSGNTGFFEKDITDMSQEAWTFHRTDAPLVGEYFLDNVGRDASTERLGEVLDRPYSANMDRLTDIAARTGVGREDIALEVPDFNPLCSPATLRVHFGPDDSLELVLHTVDGLRLEPRAEGLDAEPRPYDATIEIPAATLENLDGLSPRARDFVRTYLGDARFTALPIHVTADAMIADVGLEQWDLVAQ